jgi:hypothetical protein
VKLAKALVLAGIAAILAAAPASAVDTRKLKLNMTVSGKVYSVVAEPFSSWQLASEGEISLDYKFPVQAGGEDGLIQVRLAPGAIPGKQINPCGILGGLSQSLKKQGLRLSPGRKLDATMNPVCSMIVESTMKTVFYYSASFNTGNLLVAGVARSTRDLTDAQIAEFSRYLASIQATPKEVSQ